MTSTLIPAGQHGRETGYLQTGAASASDEAQGGALIDVCVCTYRRSQPLRIEYIHAPAGNIALARNACLDHSHAPLIAFIDDDEIAEVDWLAPLYRGLQSLDVVFGPVQAQYAIDTPEWMRRGDFHSKVPVLRRDGHCDTGYTANVLLRRECIGARLGYCAVASLVCLWSPVHWRRQWLRGSLHLGVIATALGAVDVEIYGGSNASDV